MGIRTRNRANNVNADGTPLTLGASVQPVKDDVTALALREATNESSAAFNLPNTFIDTFSDDTNLGTQTDVDRVSGHMTTHVTAIDEFVSDADTLALLHMNGANAGTVFTDSSSHNRTITRRNQPTTTTGEKKFGSASAFFDGSDDSLSMPDSGDWIFGTNDFTFETWIYMDTNTGSEVVELLGQAKTNSTDQGGAWSWHITANAGNKQGLSVYQRNSTTTADDFTFASGTALSLSTWHHIAVTRDGGTIRFYLNGVQDNSVSMPSSSGGNLFTGALAGDLWISKRSYTDSYGMLDGQLDEMRISNNCRYTSGTTFTPNERTTSTATGTLIQSANTVDVAKTKVAGTMLYKDGIGTGVIGTDLKIYFSCDNGSNWTEAVSYDTITPVYSTGVKQVRLGETTCTSGTGVIYKAVWANQADTTKETQLHGIGINY
ncbi:uncharacterized protein METZ01_LOCUS82265 [marine metagenome]|uniref:LamG-like jellyroll fold domain-containing protein n=1 Tax=marine metagenome TaxID=408172 RepID=A0A381UNT2_9ZZZZ